MYIPDADVTVGVLAATVNTSPVARAHSPSTVKSTPAKASEIVLIFKQNKVHNCN